MIKNTEIFDGTDKSKCIDWLIQVEAAVQFMNTPLRDIVLSQVSPAIYSVLKGLPADATDEEVKQLILSNIDAGTTTEAASRLENLKMDRNKPLITFNARYKALHNIAFGFGPEIQTQKLQLTMYASRLPYDTSKKLLKKLSKENSYVNTLKAAFKAALEINRKTSFVNASMAQQEENKGTSIDAQINKLDDSFQDMDINYMNTRSSSQNSQNSNRLFNSSFSRSSKSSSQTPLEVTDQTLDRTTSRDTTTTTTTVTMNNSTETTSTDMITTRMDTTIGGQSTSTNTTTISQDNK